ncbi:MAG: hypothetical protein EKK35_23605 [Bradyrhizobiaceae bacterium]|nr:MAG: hypothetical protein EKK35_23605 [Bradyrhizobiaceae bacterium]
MLLKSLYNLRNPSVVGECTIRNLSDTGAALEVVSPLGIPHEFDLIVEADSTTRQCRVVWRKERRIGVTFLG